MDVGNQSYQFLKNNAILCRCNCVQCDNSLNKDQNGPVLIGLRWMSEFSNGFHFNDVFQCEFLAFYLAEMFKDTLCRKITYHLINNFSILSRTIWKWDWQLNNYLFFIQIFSVRSWSMISSTIQTYLKTYLKRKEDKAKNYAEEKRLK